MVSVSFCFSEKETVSGLCMFITVSLAVENQVDRYDETCKSKVRYGYAAVV